MNGISGYQIYQQGYQKSAEYVSAAYEKKTETGKAAPAEKSKSTANVKLEAGINLSDEAKELLERLKEKYGNMDIMVANYGSDEEAQKYLSAGTKEYSVLIDPELLEQMAADEATEKKYTDMIDDATAKLTEVKNELGDDTTAVHIGISVGADGGIKYFAELEKSTEKQRERIEKKREEKKEEKKKAEKSEEKAALTEPVKKTRVSADSTQELIRKIREVDWDKIRPEYKKTKGGVIDFGV